MIESDITETIESEGDKGITRVTVDHFLLPPPLYHLARVQLEVELSVHSIGV